MFKIGENKRLKERIQELEGLMTPEVLELDTLNRKKEELEKEIRAKNADLATLEEKIQKATAQLAEVKVNLIETNDAILLQEFGLYEPKYEFANSEGYKNRLEKRREKQKALIRNHTAATGSTNWTVNNNAAKGRKMVSDMQKLLLRAFNSECDEVISRVKFNNIESAEKRITASNDAISKLGSMMGVSISQHYFRLKIMELHLAYEYQVKKQEEKEEQRQIREELREQAKLQKELEDARKKIQKDKQHYENALKQLQEKLINEPDETKKADIAEKIATFQTQLGSLDKELQEVDYREANQKAGYVYIISNIGAFGEDVYKIGMTRRLDPMDRINELGDASVPFRFDVHAIIFTEDAPSLESALHRAFEDKRINKVNNRKEFYHVSLDEIKKIVKESYDKTVDFVDIPEAEQFRTSLLIDKKSEQSSNRTCSI